MLNESEKYLLSLYKTVEIIKEDGSSVIEKTVNSYDGLNYIKRTFKDDKRAVFNRLAEISNPHLPAINGVFYEDSTIVIEEFIDGITLRELIDKGKISSKQAYSIAVQLFNALKALHKNGIIHRDIKPENIIITPDGNAYLIDFGIARLYNEAHNSDTRAMGTQGYAAPEQYGFSQSDSRTDIYSLGATLDETVKNVKGARAVKRAARRCMSFDPAARYQSASQALKSLKLFKRLPAVLICAGCAVCVFFIHSYSLPTASLPSASPSTVSSPSAFPSTVSSPSAFPSTVSSPTASPVETDYEAAVSINPSDSMRNSLKLDNEDNSYKNYIPVITNQTGKRLTMQKLTPTDEPEPVTISGGTQMSYTLTDGVLTLKTDSQEFVFEYVPQIESKNYGDTAIDGDLTLYDLNGDGSEELLVALSDHIIVETLAGPMNNTNWSAVWVLTSEDGSTFELADGVAASEFRGITLTNSGGTDKLILDEYNVFYTFNGSELELNPLGY